VYATPKRKILHSRDIYIYSSFNWFTVILISCTIPACFSTFLNYYGHYYSWKSHFFLFVNIFGRGTTLLLINPHTPMAPCTPAISIIIWKENNLLPAMFKLLWYTAVQINNCLKRISEIKVATTSGSHHMPTTNGLFTVTKEGTGKSWRMHCKVWQKAPLGLKLGFTCPILPQENCCD